MRRFMVLMAAMRQAVGGAKRVPKPAGAIGVRRYTDPIVSTPFGIETHLSIETPPARRLAVLSVPPGRIRS